MPSLKNQLQNLQAPVSRSLGVEKERASLLFDRKQASSFTTEEFYNLGLSGLEQLRKVDRSLGDYEQKLFELTTINLNRAILSKEENEELSETLDRMIIYLSPYFNHQGCKNVLEWLIHKYHIHLYNAPTIINAFMVYHSTNSFGRLLKILRIDRPEFEFTKEFSKEGLPLPFNSILKACLKGGSNYFLVGSYSNFLQQAIQLVGEEYVSERMQMHFTFFASLVVHLFEDTANITEQLVSRIIPYVGAALKSNVLPFKLSGFVIICDLAMNTSLNEDTLMNVLKLSMLKMREEWFEVSMNAVLVICQRQSIKYLPKKALLKLLRKGEQLNLNHYLTDAMTNYDLTGFVVPFVNTAFEALAQEEDSETITVFTSYIKIVLNLETLTDSQASAAIRACLENLLVNESGQVPEELRLLLKQIIIRFSQAFDAIRAEMLITNKDALTRLIEQCGIAEHEIGVLTFEDKKKRRRRSSQSRNYDEEPIDTVETLTEQPKAQIQKMPKTNEQLKNLKEGGDVQKAFKEPPATVLKYLKAGESEFVKLKWALKTFESDKYLAKQSSDELEDFLVGVIRFISQNSQYKHKSLLKEVLLKIKLSEKLLLSLITPYDEEESNKAKRGRFTSSDNSKVFSEETDIEFEARLTFVLELYNSSVVIKADKEFVRRLFDLIEINDKPLKGYSSIKNPVHVQQLILALICKTLKEQDANSLVDKQMNFTSLVNVIQFTHDTIVLQNALKVLICVASLMPNQMTTQIMSLFTFMGDGLLKKDNELTLTVVEEALDALFSAILNAVANQPLQYQRRLLDVSQIFAKTLPDIPIHRRLRLLKTLANCISPDYLWIIFAVIFVRICSDWNKEKSRDKSGVALTDNCSDFVTTLPPEQQIRFSLNLLEYAVSLGGDADSIDGLANAKRFPLIFDRKSQTIKSFRHYRFMITGFILKIFAKKSLPEQFSELTNKEIYERILPTNDNLIRVMVSLKDFVTKELSITKTNDKSTHSKESGLAVEYWSSMVSRVEKIIKKLQDLLPEEVRVLLLSKFVGEEEIDEALCEQAPQILNVELPTDDDQMLEEQKSESFEDQLNNLVEKMNASLNIPSELTGLTTKLQTLLTSSDAAENIEELAPQLFPLFFELLNVRQNTFKKSTPEEIQNSEQATSDAFVALVESLSEEDLKPVFSQLSDWVEEALKPTAKSKIRHRVLTVYSFANKFYNHYKNLALTYFSQLFVYAPKILKSLNVATTDADELFIDGTSEENSSNQVADQLITAIIDFINNCAKHSHFMGDDRAELVYEAVLDEIENRKVPGYKKRCAEHLVDCIYQICEASPDLFNVSLCQKLLDKMQNGNARVRLQATAIFQKLVIRMEDGIASLLPTISPYLQELQNDSDPKVAEQCAAVIDELRRVFGEDIMNDR